jgi:hypothetical protein
MFNAKEVTLRRHQFLRTMTKRKIPKHFFHTHVSMNLRINFSEEIKFVYIDSLTWHSKQAALEHCGLGSIAMVGKKSFRALYP